MRISAWSSDVCSSDLSGREISISVHRCARADPPYAAGIGVGNEQQALAQMSGDGGAGDDPEIVLPIRAVRRGDRHLFTAVLLRPQFAGGLDRAMPVGDRPKRSEEHTSELQSLMRITYAVFCLK